MTRKDRYYRLGLWILCALFCVQSASFLLVLNRIRNERKRIENASSSISAFARTIVNDDSRPQAVESVSPESPKDVSAPIYPYTIAIGSGRTKSSTGRLMLYTDYRTYTTNGVFTTSRKYIKTPFYTSNAVPVRAGAPGTH